VPPEPYEYLKRFLIVRLVRAVIGAEGGTLVRSAGYARRAESHAV
jgi:hypothetical protein